MTNMRPTPTSSAPSSPVLKRRRTTHEDGCSSPASNLRKAVRIAIAEESSPRARNNRVNEVYEIFRQRALQNKRSTKFDLFNDEDCDEENSNQNNNHSHQRQSNCNGDDNNAVQTETQPATEEAPGDKNINVENQNTQADEINNSTSDNTNITNENSEENDQTIHQDSVPSNQATSCCSNPNPCNHNSQHENRKVSPGVFPGKGAPAGCEHYERNCWIQAACCKKYYPCRRCHDEHETHEIDRHATEKIACVKCGETNQDVSNKCIKCGVQFAKYFCSICKFYDDRVGQEAYHCKDCGICRVGKGLGIDNYHCHSCDNCISIYDKDTHICKEKSLDSNCPICTEYLATSTAQVTLLKCGHCIHIDCLHEHTKTSYTCPICLKSVTDMSQWFQALDERLAEEVMPSEYQNRISRVFCHDCELKSDVPFHFMYHKCTQCQGYNTAVLEQFDKPLLTPLPIPAQPENVLATAPDTTAN